MRWCYLDKSERGVAMQHRSHDPGWFFVGDENHTLSNGQWCQQRGYGQIEADGRMNNDSLPFLQVIISLTPVQVVSQGPMADHDSFRLSSGSRGIDHISKIGGS